MMPALWASSSAESASDAIDAALVEDGTIAPHPPLAGSQSSGYRLLERAYAEIIQKLPAEIVPIVPVWLEGTARVLPKNGLPIPRPVKVKVHFGEPLKSERAWLADKASWKVMSARVRDAVMRLRSRSGGDQKPE